MIEIEKEAMHFRMRSGGNRKRLRREGDDDGGEKRGRSSERSERKRRVNGSEKRNRSIFIDKLATTHTEKPSQSNDMIYNPLNASIYRTDSPKAPAGPTYLKFP